MVMDIAVGVIFAATVIFCIARGFMLTVLGFFKGVASWVIAWIFCDDLAAVLVEKTQIVSSFQETVDNFIDARFETSDLYGALPDMFKGENGFLNNGILTQGTAKFSEILVTILCFVAIVVVLRLVLAILTSFFKKQKEKDKDEKSAIQKIDVSFGAGLGVVLGLAYACLFLALLVPVVTFIVPGRLEEVMGWFDGSIYSRWLYDNNLLLIALQRFLA